MAKLACKDLGMECGFVAEGSSPRKVKNKMFEHARDEHPELIAGITEERRRELERAMDEAIALVPPTDRPSATDEGGEVMMAVSPQDLVGREVYARDEMKVGTVKELVCEGECCVVRRTLLSKIVVPVKAIDSSGDWLVIPLAWASLDSPPKCDTKHALSAQDRSRLEEFYTPHVHPRCS